MIITGNICIRVNDGSAINPGPFLSFLIKGLLGQPHFIVIRGDHSTNTSLIGYTNDSQNNVDYYVD